MSTQKSDLSSIEAQANQVKETLKNSPASSSFPSAIDPVLRDEPLEFETSAHKFELHPPQAQQHETPAYEYLGELPESYGTAQLYLTARDPYFLYAYWDFSGGQIHELELKSHDGKVFLQLYHASGARVQQIQIHPHTREWLLHVHQPDTAFFAELGYYNRDGQFDVASRSGIIVTPRDNLSWKTHAQFVTIPFDYTFKQLLEMIGQHQRAGEDLAETLARLQEDGSFEFPFPTHGVQRLPESAQRELSKYMGEGDIVRRTRMGSFDMVDILRRKLVESTSTSSGQWPTSMSSPFGASFGARERGFFMNLNAELIIYGGTDPKARVRIDGEDITLTPDGTFSYHFNFKDGKYHIPIDATSPDGVEIRSALLSFLRLTATTDGVDATPQQDRATPLGEVID
jgi:hypothetical protein